MLIWVLKFSLLSIINPKYLAFWATNLFAVKFSTLTDCFTLTESLERDLKRNISNVKILQ